MKARFGAESASVMRREKCPGPLGPPVQFFSRIMSGLQNIFSIPCGKDGIAFCGSLRPVHR